MAFVSLSITPNFEVLEDFCDFHDFRRPFGTILGLKIDSPMTCLRVLFEKIELFMHILLFDDFSEQNTEKLSTQENQESLKTIDLPRKNNDFQDSSHILENTLDP